MIEYTTHTLSNGLRVVHNYDGATQMVAVNLLYDVGARDESPRLTGMAHLFEHLMFGGSVNVPEFDTVIEGAGGVSNAWTSNDFTNFYEVLPAVNLDTALYLESDRMLSLSFNPRSLEVQRSVVTEEFKQQCLNRPYGDIMHHLRSLVYTSHPYRYPVIGKEIDHIARVTDDDVRRFFFSHYSPDRAVLAISGNVSADHAFGRVAHWFGDIPRRDTAARHIAPEPEQTAPRTATVRGNVPVTAIIRAYRMGGYFDSDYIPADIITDILSNGQSSRLYRRLLMGTDIFSSIDASILGSEEPGLMLFSAKLHGNADDDEIARALDAIDGAIHELTVTEPPTAHELQRSLNRFEATRQMSSMSYQNRALMLAEAVMHGEDVNAVVPRYRATTLDDINEAARTILVPEHSSTLIYRPAN